ncbi:hypothetical protein GCM10027160_35630 [Streptomyces calidiresistens]|uniref:Putative zinc-finger domain-containing protein n=1 Tax=Streptomyces calidiresistens TaxID=1485586 RepID=A0A7W3XXK0_9ACTN|nr:zf-HC2 domain-containing protein [Streptomyces calidiresistens]MBB0230978.1 hypothetical protein [Streptomyces calidiresistens]
MSERHPDDVRLAEWAEGLLPPGQAASIDAHLGECARCRAVEEDLTLLREELAHLNDDLRMPGDIAARLDLALASLPLIATVDTPGSPDSDHAGEGARDAADLPVSRETSDDRWASFPSSSSSSSFSSSGSPEDVSRDAPSADRAPLHGDSGDSGHAVVPTPIGTTSPGDRGRRRRPALVLAASAALLALGSAGMLLPHLFDDGAADTTAAGDAAPREDSAGAVPESGAAADGEAPPDAREVGHRVRLLLLASETEADLFSEGDGNEEAEEHSGPGTAHGDAEGDRRDSPDTEGSGREETLGTEDAPPALPEGAENGLDTSELTDEVPGCIRSAIGRRDMPLVAEENYDYGGTRAYLVVLPHGGNARLVDAFVVDASCVTGSTAADPGDVLFETSFIRD